MATRKRASSRSRRRVIVCRAVKAVRKALRQAESRVPPDLGRQLERTLHAARRGLAPARIAHLDGWRITLMDVGNDSSRRAGKLEACESADSVYEHRPRGASVSPRCGVERIMVVDL